MNRLDPEDFIITRKRKKYKFALFANATNCFEAEDFQQWLQDNSPYQQIDTLEIGAGTGLFSVELASRYPEKKFVALDVKADRLQKGARQALELELSNIWFVRARADQIDELFFGHSLSEIWLTFSDPFPKNRSAGRRLTHPTFLKKYRQLLASDGSLLIKHDNPEFFNWSLEQLVQDGWRVQELSFDLHDSQLDDDYKILTTYEQRWLGEGRMVYFVKSRTGD